MQVIEVAPFKTSGADLDMPRPAGLSGDVTQNG